MSCRSRPVYAPRQARHPVPTSRRRARSDQAGPRGRAAGREWHHLPDRGQAATLTADAGATGHNARERGSDERGPRGRHLPDRDHLYQHGSHLVRPRHAEYQTFPRPDSILEVE